MFKQIEIKKSVKVSVVIMLSILAAMVIYSLFHYRFTGILFPGLGGYIILPLRHWAMFGISTLLSTGLLYLLFFKIDIVKRFLESLMQDATETHAILECEDQEKEKSNLFPNWRFEIVYPLISGLLCLVIVSFVLNLFYIDWRVPFTVTNDAVGGLSAAQSHIRGDVRIFPTGVGIALLQQLKMWFLSLFINENGMLVNVYYVLTFFTTGVTTTFALRLLRIRPILSILGGVLYCFLPYHFFRGTMHLSLSTYAIIPLVCVVALWICSGELKFSKKHKSRIILAFAIIVLLSMTNIVFSFLAGSVLAFAVFWNLIKFRSLKKLIAPTVLCLTLVFLVALFLMPYFLHIAGGGTSAVEGSQRTLRCVEIYSLRFVEMLLPVTGHRVHFMENFRADYVSQVSLIPNEGTASSSLGLLMSIGFIVSIFIAVRRRYGLALHNSAVLNVFIFILGTQGGLSSFIIFIVSYQRTYNRLSIFIAFYSLFIVLSLLDKLLKKIIKSRGYVAQLCSVVLVVAIGTVSLLDQIPASTGSVFQLATQNQNQSSWNADRDFVRQVEKITPEGSMVFQLPFIPSDHHVAFRGMGLYDEIRPVLHSYTLSWSRRPGLGTDAERWQRRVSALPTDQMLRHIAAYGYRGIYIDIRGFLGDDAQVLIEDIYSITNVSPIISEHAFMYYFYIGDFADYVNARLSDRDRILYLWEFNDESQSKYVVVPLNVVFPFSYDITPSLSHDTLISGWGIIEYWGVWSEGYTAELGFSAFAKDASDLELTFSLRTFPNPTYLSVYVNNALAEEIVLPAAAGHMITMPVLQNVLAEEISIEGIISINVRFEIANPVSPRALGLSDDPRELGIGLEWFSVRMLESG